MAELSFAGTTLWSSTGDVGRLTRAGAGADPGIVSRHLVNSRGNYAKLFGSGSAFESFACKKKFSSKSSAGSFMANVNAAARSGLGTLVAGDYGSFSRVRMAAPQFGDAVPTQVGASIYYIQDFQFTFELMNP